MLSDMLSISTSSDNMEFSLCIFTLAQPLLSEDPCPCACFSSKAMQADPYPCESYSMLFWNLGEPIGVNFMHLEFWVHAIRLRLLLMYQPLLHVFYVR